MNPAQQNDLSLSEALTVSMTLSDSDGATDSLKPGATSSVNLAIELAVVCSNLTSLQSLLDKFLDESRVVIETRRDIFHKAVSRGDVAIIELLLSYGADLHGVYHNKTPLMMAGEAEVAKRLIQRGADVNQRTNTTALINVLYRPDINYDIGFPVVSRHSKHVQNLDEVAIMLIENGARVNDADHQMTTALMLCA
ncbi:hypothetical protein Btru_052920 [Bulinus truncatus]|nr:hypothetical protein Btru_052920 [Bulinus truncatus]